MNKEIRELNENEYAVDKNYLVNILEQIQELKDMIFAQNEIIGKIAIIKGKKKINE